jgi:hypothetical protein
MNLVRRIVQDAVARGDAVTDYSTADNRAIKCYCFNPDCRDALDWYSIKGLCIECYARTFVVYR